MKMTILQYLAPWGKIPENACLRWDTFENMRFQNGLIENKYEYEIKNVETNGVCGADIRKTNFRSKEELISFLKDVVRLEKNQKAFNEQIKNAPMETLITDCGEYKDCVKLDIEGEGNKKVTLYYGKNNDGLGGLIVSNNARNWVVGDCGDKDKNNEQWEEINVNFETDDVLDMVREYDEDLAEFLEKNTMS